MFPMLSISDLFLSADTAHTSVNLIYLIGQQDPPFIGNFMGRYLRTTLTFGGRNLVRCLFGMEVMNMPMIVYTRRRI